MQWIMKYIQDLPWWAPGMITLSFYWLPRFLLWPFRKIKGLWEHAEFGENFVLIMFIPVYLVYILSRTVEQLAELVLILMALGSIVYWGGALLYIVIRLGDLLFFPSETLGLGKHKKTKTIEDWEANINREWFHVMPGMKRKRKGGMSDVPPDTNID